MRILVIFWGLFFHAIQHKRLRSWFEGRGTQNLQWMRCIFNCMFDHQLFHCSLRGQNAISQPEPQPLQCHHGVLPAGFLLVAWPDQKYYREGPTSQCVSLSLSFIYNKYSRCTTSIIHMCIITYACTYLCIIILLYFITFYTSILYYSCITIPFKYLYILSHTNIGEPDRWSFGATPTATVSKYYT